MLCVRFSDPLPLLFLLVICYAHAACADDLKQFGVTIHNIMNRAAILMQKARVADAHQGKLDVSRSGDM